jgi:hypothetical protein
VDNYKDIAWVKDNNRGNKASNAKHLAVAAVEQTQQRRKVTCCKQCCNRTDASTPKAMMLAKQGKDTSAMLMVALANANNDTSTVHARMPAHHRQDGSSVTTTCHCITIGKTPARWEEWCQRKGKDSNPFLVVAPAQG